MSEIVLSTEAIELLQAAVDSKRTGGILRASHSNGVDYLVDDQSFLSGKTPREQANYTAAIEELVEHTFLVQSDDVFTVTKAGYDFSDTLPLNLVD